VEKQHRDKHRPLWHSRLPAPERRPEAETDTLSRLGALGDQYLASLSHARKLGAEIEQQVEIAKAARATHWPKSAVPQIFPKHRSNTSWCLSTFNSSTQTTGS
jgi:hypothetical protein